jgi:hypothetical protein
MIRLFRKVRQRLLSENNYGMYILYASGEIILVVVGILLALQIDNRKEIGNTSKVTQEYLINIRKDLVADTVALNDLITQAQGWEDRINAYYEFYNQQQWSIQEIVDSCNSTGFIFMPYIPIDNTIGDMLSSGKTGLLNDNIRMRLAQLEKRQDLLVMISEHLIGDIKKNVHELEKYWNMEQSYYFAQFISKSRKVIDQQNIKIDLYDEQDLIKGLRFQHNIFNWTYSHIELIKIHGRSIINQSEEIIEQIDSELQ